MPVSQPRKSPAQPRPPLQFVPAPGADTVPAADLHETRFRNLVGEAGWARLPDVVRRRFSKCLAPGEAVLYRGRVLETTLSPWGRILATLARMIGGPLPFTPGATGAAVVSVMGLPGASGQIWTRTYERPGGFPQVVHSMKRFAGPTGLEEYVGFGVGMTLTVTEVDGALHFRSAGYFVDAGGWRVRLPRVLEPGTIRITHRDLGGGAFRFDLELRRGDRAPLIRQCAIFEDCLFPGPLDGAL